MPDIVTSQVFTDGEKGITATKMNNIVAESVIQPDFYAAKPASPVIDPTDQLLELKSTGAYARITGAQLSASVANQLVLADATQNGMLRKLSGLTTDFVDGTNNCQDFATALHAAIGTGSGGTSHYYDYDDFINGPPKFVGLTAVGAGSSAAVVSSGLILDHPGVLILNPGTTSTGAAYANSAPIRLSTLPYMWRALVAPSVPLGHNIYYSFGFQSAGGSLINSTSYILVYYNTNVGPNWLCQTLTAGAGSTAFDTGVPGATGWSDLQIIATSTSVQFWINGVLATTVTTHIPANTIPLYPIVVAANNGDTGNFGMSVDLVEIDLATPLTKRFSKSPI